jgi:hypothetical protein
MSDEPAFVLPGDGWFLIEPRGDHYNAQAGKTQRIDAEAVRAISQRFMADRTTDCGLPIDIDHLKWSPQNETRAYGWLVETRESAEGLEGRIRWTTVGKRALEGGEYRFFSTEYAPSDLQDLGNGIVRPTRLSGLSLTNLPNNRGGRPITNNASSCPGRVFGHAVPMRVAESDPILNSQQRQGDPRREFLDAVKRIQQTGTGFDRAWDQAKIENRAAFEKFCGPAIVNQERSRPATAHMLKTAIFNICRDAALREQKSDNLPWDQAWGRVKNRAAGILSDDVDTARILADAKKMFLAFMENPHPPEPYHFRNDGDAIRFGDEAALDMATKQPGLSPEEIWDALERENPGLFASYASALYARENGLCSAFCLST